MFTGISILLAGNLSIILCYLSLSGRHLLINHAIFAALSPEFITMFNNITVISGHRRVMQSLALFKLLPQKTRQSAVFLP